MFIETMDDTKQEIMKMLLLIVITSSWITMESSACNLTIHWADDDYENVLDEFFDKSAIITSADGVGIAPGMFIDYNKVLSAYNPFRWYRAKGGIQQIRICVLKKRITYKEEVVEKKDDVVISKVVLPPTYVFESQSHWIDCARQIIPKPDWNYTSFEWHGNHNKASGLHDLIVFKLKPHGLVYRPPGSLFITFPVIVDLPTLNSTLENSFIFASLGFTDKNHTTTLNHFRSTPLLSYDDLYVDCNRWMIKVWGLFICLNNTYNYPAIGTGALLIHDNKLFAIGSFLLRKGKSSIMVFTDLRPYLHMLPAPCTHFEQLATGNNDEF